MTYERIDDDRIKLVETKERIFEIKALKTKRSDLMKEIEEIDAMLLEASKIGVVSAVSVLRDAKRETRDKLQALKDIQE